MKRVIGVLGMLTLTCGLWACDYEPSGPSDPSSSPAFTARLLPANEIPPIAGSESDASGTATLTVNLTKDSAGYITAATLDATVSVTGFPPGTALTASHIHPGAAGVNGGVAVSLGLSQGEVTFATGSGSFTKRGVTMTIDQANAILANPSGFYLNIHTAANPGGVARGQLARVP